MNRFSAMDIVGLNIQALVNGGYILPATSWATLACKPTHMQY